MDFVETGIAGVVEIRFDIRADKRGRFKRQFCRLEFAAAGLMTDIAQVNHSITLGRGSIRGLHYQLGSRAESKLVTCTYGRVFDVAVDLRPDSPTYLQFTALELDESVAFHIPKGCAHGFQALTDEVHLVYLHSEFYHPQAEGGVRYDDPALGIGWPLDPTNLSERDSSFPLIGDDFAGVTL
jgi:dTDP-4-dehydrorhamnose 3,5-epimerase